MADEQILTTDDERVAFAARLGWDVQARATDDPIEVEQAAGEYFQRDALASSGYDTDLDGVDQALLDEVRDAVVRRQRQTAPPAGA